MYLAHNVAHATKSTLRIDNTSPCWLYTARAHRSSLELLRRCIFSISIQFVVSAGAAGGGQNVLGWLKRGGCRQLLERAEELGVVSIRRAFGDFSNRSVASRQVELQRHGFDLVHTLHPAKLKSNSADIRCERTKVRTLRNGAHGRQHLLFGCISHVHMSIMYMSFIGWIKSQD